MDDKTAFANRFSVLRNRTGKTEEDFADEFSEYSGRRKGFSPLTISSWDTGTRFPTLGTIVDLARYFKVSSDYLLGLSNIENPEGTDLDEDGAIKESKKEPGLLIKKENLKHYDGQPVYVVFKDKTFSDAWGLVDAKMKRVVFSDKLLPFSTRIKCTFYAEVPINERDPMYHNRRALSITQVSKSKKVWVELRSTEGYIKGRYDGWYDVHSDKELLVSHLGLVLPFEGLSISFNAYHSDN